ncbi:glutaredoxin family protein [Arsukibacterium sp.]|uniref:glutaredoxin family protein n=1 Tax=Arsukibacterium sp. TaxID=1977258 RepID=UPI00299F2C81|nr:glutaredoxin family protein [Arsukibacterium sp.]MDX1678168.1 glutaredoxin family protein [Arsukibacterium sp.]
MIKVVLYSTWGCHLCEQAETVLGNAGITFRVVDIVDDDQLFQQFRLHIPVVAAAESLLYWPFNEIAVLNWANEIKAKDTK